MTDTEPIEQPIDGVLDLHTFRPSEAKDLLPDYLEECRKRGIYRVRIIHGKGTGTLRRIVESVLKKLAYVERIRPGDETGGGWGATLVDLREKTEPSDRG